MTAIVLGLSIRADASPGTGTGHVMRCLALALAALRHKTPACMIVRAGVPWVAKHLKQEDVPHILLPDAVPACEAPQELLRQLHAAGAESCWVVLDGYHFGLDCQQAVRDAGYKLLVIDDYAHLPEYSCDILLNQNIGAEDLVYKGDIGQKLLGPEYALLRPEFLAARSRAQKRSFTEEAQNILLTLGGGDFSEHLARIAPVFSISQLAGRTVRVIAGAMPPERIHALLQDCPAKLEILSRVDDMPALLLDTDICVTAGGSTCWELCCLGVPLLTVEVAENQQAIVHGLQANGIAPALAPDAFIALLRDSAARKKRSDAGSALVGGLGAGRVIHAMTE
ncbi:MAG: UDP-2,4-diacetamido-2,4,6-trideoxy-beta-L-altropyranose hydrolase [Deltaproteobacteria bacterium]|jgi:UDP-2,4-diacetamido-2,4,6-trideoxy-beta-L-altropyranose hydrolase|nr:UDP-2,4-diacetamido-2,4,6-trideoxy-beta-L-altropyranose hydrolase [Deltaproteobacteria bacterium]